METSYGNPPPNLSPVGAGKHGAFRQAKRDAGIPMGQQPSKVEPNIKNGQIRDGTAYHFTDQYGNDIIIRHEPGGHFYGPNNPQNRGPHYNGPNNTHYDYSN